MPIPLKLTADMMKQLFPDAKAGDSFEATIEGKFMPDESGELMPSVDTVEGQPVMGDEASESPDMESSESPADQSAEGSSEMPMPTDDAAPKSPMAMQAKDDLVSKLKAIRGDKVNQKYA